MLCLNSDVIEERRKKVAEREPIMNSNSLMLTKKQYVTKSGGESVVLLPIDGYSSNNTSLCYHCHCLIIAPMFGEELDSPVIYISAVIEMSEHPLLPVYNIQVSPGDLRPRLGYYKQHYCYIYLFYFILYMQAS